MKDVTSIRSMTNKEGNHERATYQLHTGYPPSGTVKHPSFGCVTANELGDPKFDLPISSASAAARSARRHSRGLARAVRGAEPHPAPSDAVPPVNTARFYEAIGPDAEHWNRGPSSEREERTGSKTTRRSTGRPRG